MLPSAKYYLPQMMIFPAEYYFHRQREVSSKALINSPVPQVVNHFFFPSVLIFNKKTCVAFLQQRLTFTSQVLK